MSNDKVVQELLKAGDALANACLLLGKERVQTPLGQKLARLLREVGDTWDAMQRGEEDGQRERQQQP